MSRFEHPTGNAQIYCYNLHLGSRDLTSFANFSQSWAEDGKAAGWTTNEAQVETHCA